MRYTLVIILLGLSLFTWGQHSKPESISVSYYGEMITHPGLRISVDYNIKEWDKKKNASKIIQKSIIVSPSIGFYYHRNYQTGLFLLPEIKYKRQNPNGVFYEVGIGLGYLRTFIPNTYEVNEGGEVKKVISGYNYFASEGFVTLGKNFTVKKNVSMAWFIKPQFMYAVPNFPNGTGYFALEAGISYSFQ